MQAAVASPATPAPLWRNRTFVILWFGAFVSQIGDGVTRFAIPLWLVLQGELMGAGVVLLVPQLIGLAWMPFAGVVGDRQDQRRIMLTADVARGLVLMGGAWLWASGALNVPGLICMVTALTVFSKLAGPAFDVALRTIAGEDQLTQMQGALQLADRGAYFAALIGGTMYAVGGLGAALAVDGLSFVVSALAVLLCRWDSRPSRTVTRGIRGYAADLRDGARELLRNRAILLLTLVAAATNCAIAATDVLIPAHGVHALQIGAVELGWVETSIAVGFMLGTVLITVIAARARKRAGRWILLGLTGSSLGIAGFGLTGSLWLALPLLCAGVIAQGAAITVYAGAVVRATPPEMTARVGAMRRFVASAAIPLGPLLGALAAERFSAGVGMVLAGAVMLVAVGVAALAPEVRRMEA